MIPIKDYGGPAEYPFYPVISPGIKGSCFEGHVFERSRILIGHILLLGLVVSFKECSRDTNVRLVSVVRHNKIHLWLFIVFSVSSFSCSAGLPCQQFLVQPARPVEGSRLSTCASPALSPFVSNDRTPRTAPKGVDTLQVVLSQSVHGGGALLASRMHRCAIRILLQVRLLHYTQTIYKIQVIMLLQRFTTQMWW